MFLRSEGGCSAVDARTWNGEEDYPRAKEETRILSHTPPSISSLRHHVRMLTGGKSSPTGKMSFYLLRCWACLMDKRV